MPLRKCKLFIIAIVTIYCICLEETGTTAIEEHKFVTSDITILDYELLSNEHESVTDEGIVNVNDTESNELQQDECQCKNGRCVKKGDTEVCECFPEYGKINDTVCKFCDCGPGFNCTYRKIFGTEEKFCQCTDDYQQRNKRCIIKCNSERPCQNGGTCSLGQCTCPKYVSGDLCENFRWCENKCYPRQEVDCVYVSDYEYNCLCKNRSLVYDDDDLTCKPCPCGAGNCTLRYRSLGCSCNNGYIEFRKTCKSCDCGWAGSCRLDWAGRKQCTCQEGYVEREGRCMACDCGIPGTTCSIKNGVKSCECPKGYKDHFGRCVDINECQSSPCHYSAICVNNQGSFTCECEKGYQGMEGRRTEVEQYEACEDIDECENNIRTCPSWENIICFNLPGTYKCMCKEGYQPVSIDVSPQDTRCIEYKRSWVPAIIVIVTAVFMIAFTVVIHKCVKKS
ncbi:uncharacterized protein NPIL_515021 [Nephila pilipes]|uniref:EGF-like domain-containing protein n=1 Tax=Nephila pilipes TaxID=299642 RepID=A0A8X6P901_NEPPI|nr:uncharacterized protein NPIL_515021 [Nephila pilipes]